MVARTQELLGLCRELGITFVAYSPLGRGFLTGAIKSVDDLAANDWRRMNPRFSDENLQENLELVGAIEDIAKAKNCTSAQLALAWVLSRGKHVVAIPGTRREERLEQNAAAADIDLTCDELARLDETVPPGVAAGSRYPEGNIAALNL